MSNILNLLDQQIADYKFDEWKRKRWMTAELLHLRPAFADLIPDIKTFTDLGQRVLAKELRHETTFKELWEIVESADMSHDVLLDFTQQAETIAGVNLATESWEECALEKRGLQECEMCAMSYGILALSACVLTEPLPVDVCKHLGHSPFGQQAYYSLQTSLESLVPPVL